jgi:hypothetical protein
MIKEYLFDLECWEDLIVIDSAFFDSFFNEKYVHARK